jgi:hypothetical protein
MIAEKRLSSTCESVINLGKIQMQRQHKEGSFKGKGALCAIKGKLV